MDHGPYITDAYGARRCELCRAVVEVPDDHTYVPCVSSLNVGEIKDRQRQHGFSNEAINKLYDHGICPDPACTVGSCANRDY